MLRAASCFIGSGLSKAMERVADVYAFLFQQLEIDYQRKRS